MFILHRIFYSIFKMWKAIDTIDKLIPIYYSSRIFTENAHTFQRSTLIWNQWLD